MRKLVWLVLAAGIMLLANCKFLRGQPHAVYHSPDNQYTARVYTESPMIAAPGQGGMSSRSVIVEVYDADDDFIGDSTDCNAPLLGDLRIEWDLENHRLWYAVARIIDLKTGECSD